MNGWAWPEPRRDGGWWGGAAAVPFPVEVGTPLAGYSARSGGATGTLDGLTVSVLALAGDDARLTLIAADVVAVDAELVASVGSALGPEAGTILLCASHTHGGPAGIVPRLHPSQPEATNAALRNRFAEATVVAARRAWRALAPVMLGVGQCTVSGVAADRNDPARPIDQRLTALHVDGADGRPLASVVHFACHPTLLGADNRLVSADLAGALRRHLAESDAGDVEAPIVPFLNGAAANVSSRFTRRAQTPTELDRFGGVLAGAARQTRRAVRPLGPYLAVASAAVGLPRRPPGGGPGAGAGARDRPTASGDRRAQVRDQGIALLSRLPTAGGKATAHLGAVVLGDLALITVPGELTASLGAAIVAGSPFATTLVVGYANGYLGYLVDGADPGSYEALASPFTAEAGPAVVAAASALLGRLGGERSRPAPPRGDG